MSCLSGLESLKPGSGDGKYLGADAQEFVIPQNWGPAFIFFQNFYKHIHKKEISCFKRLAYLAKWDLNAGSAFCSEFSENLSNRNSKIPACEFQQRGNSRHPRFSTAEFRILNFSSLNRRQKPARTSYRGQVEGDDESRVRIGQKS
jgi:hypothetical protein